MMVGRSWSTNPLVGTHRLTCHSSLATRGYLRAQPTPSIRSSNSKGRRRVSENYTRRWCSAKGRLRAGTASGNSFIGPSRPRVRSERYIQQPEKGGSECVRGVSFDDSDRVVGRQSLPQCIGHNDASDSSAKNDDLCVLHA